MVNRDEKLRVHYTLSMKARSPNEAAGASESE
jgi:hypothetical protein